MRNEKTNRHKRKKTSRRTWKLISLALLCVVLAMAAALVWLTLRDRLGTAVLQPSPVEMTAAPAQDPTEKAHKATFAAPAQQPIVLYADDGESVTVPAGPEIPGYTFLYWVDAAGNAERRQSVTVYEDLTYLGQYAVAFRDESRSAEHSPYLSLDESGLFHPNSPVTRGETVMALFQLLDINGVGSGRRVARRCGLYLRRDTQGPGPHRGRVSARRGSHDLRRDVPAPGPAVPGRIRGREL